MTAQEGKTIDTSFRLRRVEANNPSPMTGPGSSTFLLGEGEVTVIDPGPDDPAHLAEILAALAPSEAIGAILITHPHLDHSALAPALAQITGAKTYGFGPAGSGRSPQMAALHALGLPESAEGIDRVFTPDHRIADGAQLQLGGLSIEVLHTPGHMGEHLSFALGDILFCGDLIMAWAPSLVSPPEGDMSAYFKSLERIAARQWRALLPTHGAVITDPATRIAAVHAHRKKREAEILAALKIAPSTLGDLVTRIYSEVDSALWPAASRNVLAHLIDLMAKAEVQATYWPAKNSLFSLAKTELANRS